MIGALEGFALLEDGEPAAGRPGLISRTSRSNRDPRPRSGSRIPARDRDRGPEVIGRDIAVGLRRGCVGRGLDMDRSRHSVRRRNPAAADGRTRRRPRSTAETAVVAITFNPIWGLLGALGACRARIVRRMDSPGQDAANSTTHQIRRSRRRSPRSSPSPGLLQLDQRAAEVLGVEEEHGLVVGAGLGLAVAEDAGARGLQRDRGRRRYRPTSIADVMDAAATRSSAESSRPASSSPSGDAATRSWRSAVRATTVTPCAGCGTARIPWRRACSCREPMPPPGPARRWRRG